MKDRNGLSLDAVDDFRQAIDGPFSRIWLPDSKERRMICYPSMRFSKIQGARRDATRATGDSAPGQSWRS